MVERLFPISINYKINASFSFHPMKRLIRNFRSSENNRNFRHHLLKNTNQLQRLFDVPDITGETNHIWPFLKQVGHDIHHGIFDGVLCQMNILKFMLTVRF
ncbi:hypothetical protein D3C75_556140 [compost metagenome]